MLATTFSNRNLRLTFAAAALGLFAACSDSAGPDEDEHVEVVEAIRLTITASGGTQSVFTLDEAGVITPALVVPSGTSTVQATFLDFDGDDVSSDVHDDEFRLDITPATGLTFVRTAAFSGTLNATASAGTVVQTSICLYHLLEGHCDFGAFTLGATIGS